MYSAINEIANIRDGMPIDLNRVSVDRYGVTVADGKNKKTMYYFSTPVFDVVRNSPVDPHFERYEDCILENGSNASITINRKTVLMKNDEGKCVIELPHQLEYESRYYLEANNDMVVPCANGFAYYSCVENNDCFTFCIRVDKSPLLVRANDKFFSLLIDRFKPFITVSAIGEVDDEEKVIAPAIINWKKINDCEYEISVRPSVAIGRSVLWECNLYESKLYQDTTVESMHWKENNVFGSVAFIGDTDTYGERWLYIRPAEKIFKDFQNKKIEKTVIHFPMLGRMDVPLDIYGLDHRFCSFGSNWGNKVRPMQRVCRAINNGDYLSADVTALFVEDGQIKSTQGIIIRSMEHRNGYTVIPTADNYLAPIILEISFV